eukprot:scaffold69906_cov33-Tisochrysis_lutea.AAC.2
MSLNQSELPTRTGGVARMLERTAFHTFLNEQVSSSDATVAMFAMRGSSCCRARRAACAGRREAN